MNANPMAMVAAVKKKNLYLYLYEREEKREEREERRDRNEQHKKLRNEVRSNQGEKL